MLCIMAKRRMCEEANSLDEVNSPVANVTVHGAVTAVSPVKKGKRSIFFDGMLADHTARVRLFGFDSFQQRKLDELHQRRLPAEISDCEVKRSRYHEGFEVMLKNSSKIKESTREDLDVDRILENEPSAEYPETAEITLEQLPDIQLFRKVQVCVKAIIVHDAVQLSNKTKQDIIVADARSTAKLTLWEDHVGHSEGNLGNIVHTQSILDGTLTAGPCIHLCLPLGSATIFMKGTRNDINLCSNAFKHASSAGSLSSCIPLDLACMGRLPLDKAPSHVLHTHCLPSLVTYKCSHNSPNNSGLALVYLIGLKPFTECLYNIL